MAAEVSRPVASFNQSCVLVALPLAYQLIYCVCQRQRLPTKTV